jgi:hypothetical protein
VIRRHLTQNRTLRVLIAAALIVLVLVVVAALGGLVAASGHAPRAAATLHRARTHPLVRASNTRHESNSTDHVNFDNPMVDGKKLASVAHAAAALPFTPIAPPTAGAPLSIFVHGSDVPPSAQTLALVYQHPQFGRFMVIELPNVTNEQNLEAEVAQCASGCNETWSLINLHDGSKAVLIAGSAGVPYQTNAIIWLRGAVALNVVGPASTFTESDAEAVANLFEATA